MSVMAKRTTALVLSALGTLFILALVFAVIPGRYAIFAAVACYFLSGLVWTVPTSAK